MKNIDLEFFEYISGRLAKAQNVKYEWRNDNTEIVLKKKNDEGFDIIIGHHKDYLYLDTDRGYHGHFEAFENFSEMLIHVMGLARDLLSKNMRIKEISTNSKPRKWVLEHCKNGVWKKEALSGLLVWNYFGKTNVRYYSNDILPVREL
jgi:hypothetical protein